MNDRPRKPTVKLFSRPERVPARGITVGMRAVWMVLAVLFVIEVIGGVWLLRRIARAPKPAEQQTAPAAAPLPAR